MPKTYITMVIGALALAGCPPFSGFFSKDEILYSALASGHFGLWAIGVLVAGMTAYYTFRMIFVVFHGEPRDHHAYEHAQESPAVMTVPLIILAVGAFLRISEPSGIFGAISGFPLVGAECHRASPACRRPVRGWPSLPVLSPLPSGLKLPTANSDKALPNQPFRFCQFLLSQNLLDELYDAASFSPTRLSFSHLKLWNQNVTEAPVKEPSALYMLLGTAYKALQVGT